MVSNDVPEKTRLDIADVRAKLAGKTGKVYWRSLEEVADTPEFQLFMEDEFPNRASIAKIDRRTLLKFMGASVALASLAGCRGVFLPEDKVVPYVKQPEELVPGEALYYASNVTLAGYATGVLIEQREGRPIQLQGNPQHPASKGALDVMSQAEILGLYDPDRASSPTSTEDISTWPAFQEAVNALFKANPSGAGVRILSGAITSPTFGAQVSRLLAKHPQVKWHVWEPTGMETVHEGASIAFGSPMHTYYDLSKAKVIVSLDSDFLNPSENPGSLAYARQFADGRRVQGKTGAMSRVYAAESTPGLVGMVADHRWPVKAGDIFSIAMALAAAMNVAGAVAGTVPQSMQQALTAVAADLKANGGASLVVAGKHQPAAVHALVHAINSTLGNTGNTVFHTAPVELTATSAVGDLKSLITDMKSGAVSSLFVIDSNPGYSAPVDSGFAAALKFVKFKAQLGYSQDETTQLMDWHLPMTHQLEAWSDARSYEGTASIAQPLIAPLVDARSPIEFLSILAGNYTAGYELVRAHWQTAGMGGDFEKSWRQAVHDGVVSGSKAPIVKTPPLMLNASSLPAPKSGTELEIVFRPDPSIFDGRFANNGWLQEVPKPITKVSWDNVILVSMNFAQANGLVSDDRVSLEANGQKVEGPVFVQPGHPDNTITVHLGFGRTQGGVVATVNSEREGGGFNAYLLRSFAGQGFTTNGTLKKIGGQREIATTQGHSPLNGDKIIDDRDVIREATLADFLSKGEKALIPGDAPSSKWVEEQNLFPEEVFEWDGPQWGMTIDMNTCIGCNACVIACQAENNIPVVGKEQVARHRELHWIRIDRYYSGDDNSPELNWQPVMCVHCEKAPCEPVCPVAATVHSHEGLNQMIYNRCVGTRYCSNNCPYKVRHFNYLNYSDNQPNFSDRQGGEVFNQSLIPGPLNTPRKNGIELLKMLNNPDVSVRGRGIMEKCTYCVQRINYARTEAKKAGRPIADGDIVTACQQACPTNTIVFGNIADKDAAVTKLRKDPRSYLLLEELQTRPRTSHLAKLRNPNPDIKAPASEHKA